MKKILFAFSLLLFAGNFLLAQNTQNNPGSNHANKFEQLGTILPTPNEYRTASGAPGTKYWQQRVDYDIKVELDEPNFKIKGSETITYWNNSPDTLRRVFYHLYFNAFQPGSMMDVRSRRQGTISNGRNADWDARVQDRIQNLTPEQIGYQKIKSLKMNGITQQYEVLETILEVTLSKPILPRTKVVFDMEFEAQVPLQIRRSGRDNPSTGVRYSMSQWYPKMCEYDYAGWHPNPYIAREFYGIWGDFDVNITIDKSNNQ